MLNLTTHSNHTTLMSKVGPHGLTQRPSRIREGPIPISNLMYIRASSTSSSGAPWSWTTRSPSWISSSMPRPRPRGVRREGVAGSKVWRSRQGKQFLKVLASRLWQGIPPLEGVPHGNWPTPENTLLIDDSPTKSVLNPPGNVIFPDPWTGDRKDVFLVDRQTPYLRRLALHPNSILNFVRSNPIGNAALSPRDNVHKSNMRLAKFNKLI